MFRNCHIKTYLLLLIFIILPVLTVAGQARKPLSPLRINIVPVQSGVTADLIKPGDAVAFKVTASSSIDVPEMRIEVRLEGGAQLVSGNTTWSGAASKNEEKSIILTVKAPEKGKGSIETSVSTALSDGARFSAGARYVLGSTTASKPEQEHPVKKDSKGRNVIEYR